jgi:sulfate transport system substrate-binding protein
MHVKRGYMQPTNRLALVVSLAVLIFLAGCGGPATGTSNTAVGTAAADPVKLSLVAYSTPREAYEAIIPAFQQTGPGKRVSVQISYGASGDQSHAVVAGGAG